jgi:hypothetical protein
MTLRDLVFRLKAILSRRRMEDELDEELQTHLELQTRKHLAAGSGFLPPEYAWANPVRIKEGELPHIMQRILWPQWLELIQRETATPNGHVGPHMVKGADHSVPKLDLLQTP